MRSGRSPQSECVADPDVGRDVTLQRVSRPATEEDVPFWGAHDADHSNLPIQERHGDRSLHPERVHGPAPLEEEGPTGCGRALEEPAHPIGVRLGRVHEELDGARSNQREPSHPADRSR